jgi:hypothetical protein
MIASKILNTQSAMPEKELAALAAAIKKFVV